MTFTRVSTSRWWWSRVAFFFWPYGLPAMAFLVAVIARSVTTQSRLVFAVAVVVAVPLAAAIVRQLRPTPPDQRLGSADLVCIIVGSVEAVPFIGPDNGRKTQLRRRALYAGGDEGPLLADGAAHSALFENGLTVTVSLAGSAEFAAAGFTAVTARPTCTHSVGSA